MAHIRVQLENRPLKPLILGMGPTRSHPDDAWHPKALSTTNLCRLITGTATDWLGVERYFEVIDLNKRWHRIEGLGDSVQPGEARTTLEALIADGALRGGRKAFLLGEQVTNFVFALLRRLDSAFAEDAWRKLPKCAEFRLRTDDVEARIGAAAGFYDFVVIPVWHPRILMDQKVRMLPGWQQQMMNAMRLAGGLPPMKFRRLDGERRSPVDPRFPIW